jgi:DNA-binding CsgD family transcriptional regulator
LGNLANRGAHREDATVKIAHGVADHGAGVVGRDRELTTVREFLLRRSAGPRALVITGEAGIGKTTIWEAGVAIVEPSVHLLRARPAGVEVSLSLSGLGDLLAPVIDAVLNDLSPPLARALQVALLREPPDEDDAGDPLALQAGVLAALRALARTGPVVIAIDDLQWLDVPSANVLRYALRRLTDEPVALLLSRRSEDGHADILDLGRTLPHERVAELPVGPVSIDELAPLIRSRLGLSLPRPALTQVHSASGGNPFFALEIARGLGAEGRAGLSAEPLPLPRSLKAAVEGRLRALSDSALEVLVVAAALARPTISVLAEVVVGQASVSEGLSEAERAEVIRVVGDRVVFSHPLLATTIYGSVPALERRALHARLGSILLDPEERALHQAKGTSGEDADVAAALELAAESAQRRGAVDAAARLLEGALRLLPSGDREDRRRLLLAVAGTSAHAGAVRRSQELLREAVRVSVGGTERAEALYLLAESLYGTEGNRAAMAVHEEALAEPGVRPRVLADIHREVVWYALSAGMPAQALSHAAEAVAQAELAEDPVRLMKALDSASHAAFCLGTGDYSSLMSRAIALEVRHRDDVYPDDWPTTTEGFHMVWRDELDSARERFLRLAEAAVDAGDEYGRCTPYYHLALVEFAAGNWPVAERYADEAYEILFQAERTGELGSKLFARALVRAHLGKVDDARRLAEEGIASAQQSGATHAVARNLGILGFLALSLGDLEAAREHLRPAYEALEPLQFTEPGFFRFLPDYVETLVGLGDLDEAERLVRWLAERGEATGRRWAIAVAARGQALVASARGEMENALREAQRSASLLADFGQPFELGRSLLVLGAIQRRANQRRRARESLSQALELFKRLGASLWSAKAESELSRISGRTAAGEGLTDTERQIAEHVALGLRNREIADRLFVSVRTVEANLSRVYAKLGVRSRTELAQRLDKG